MPRFLCLRVKWRHITLLLNRILPKVGLYLAAHLETGWERAPAIFHRKSIFTNYFLHNQPLLMNKFLLLLLAFLSASWKLSAQCEPQLLNCNAAIHACDFSNNHGQYWNEMYWWDASNQIHDLAETKIDLNLSVLNDCPGGSQSVRCLLFLDLDGDGAQETVVDSDTFPAGGTVYYQNANNPNYSGGVARSFDERPIPADQKWKFGLQANVFGDTTVFSLQWINPTIPGLFELPELPYGNHKVRWIVTSNTGVEKVCEKTFQVKDCKAPTVVCLNGLSVNIMPTHMITLWATDFLQYAEDNTTPWGQINIAIRKSGTGTGFPVDPNGNPITSVTFDCSELGTQLVELWAIDVAGNADYCETYVLVMDNLNNCAGLPGSIEVCAKDACTDASLLDETVFEFSSHDPNLPPISYFDLGACGTFHPQLPYTEMTVTASNDDNPLNGVSAFDMVIIKKHIDGIDLLDSPYQWVAADANNDKVIDSLDILECRNLILGIYTQLPNNSSWRFIDKSYVFPSPNPLSAPFPESIVIDLNNPSPIPPEFVGVKICDVTCGNLVGFYDLEPENEHLIGTPTPNPTNDGAMLPVQLLTTENVALEVLDMSGRLLYHQALSLPAGPAMFEIPASALGQAGVYVWQLRAGAVVKSGKIVRY